MPKRERKTLNKINEFLEIPRELTTNEPKLSILGFKRVTIENFKGILEYEDFYVRVNTYIGTVNINGFNLKLEQMTDEDIQITGKIESIDIESISDEEED